MYYLIAPQKDLRNYIRHWRALNLTGWRQRRLWKACWPCGDARVLEQASANLAAVLHTSPAASDQARCIAVLEGLVATHASSEAYPALLGTVLHKNGRVGEASAQYRKVRGSASLDTNVLIAQSNDALVRKDAAAAQRVCGKWESAPPPPASAAARAARDALGVWAFLAVDLAASAEPVQAGSARDALAVCERLCEWTAEYDVPLTDEQQVNLGVAQALCHHAEARP